MHHFSSFPSTLCVEVHNPYVSQLRDTTQSSPTSIQSYLSVVTLLRSDKSTDRHNTYTKVTFITEDDISSD